MTPAPATEAERLAARLRAAIRAGELAPGSRLPSVGALAAEHGRAKGTAERALAILKREGLVVAASGSGTFVADPVPPAPVPGRSLEERVADLEAWRRSVEGGGASG